MADLSPHFLLIFINASVMVSDILYRVFNISSPAYTGFAKFILTNYTYVRTSATGSGKCLASFHQTMDKFQILLSTFVLLLCRARRTFQIIKKYAYHYLLSHTYSPQ
jgi:hypothetical protein